MSLNEIKMEKSLKETHLEYAIFICGLYVGYATDENCQRDPEGKSDWRLYGYYGQKIPNFLKFKKAYEKCSEHDMINFIKSDEFYENILINNKNHRPSVIEIKSNVKNYFASQEEDTFNISETIKNSEKSVFYYKDALKIKEKFLNGDIDFNFKFEFEKMINVNINILSEDPKIIP